MSWTHCCSAHPIVASWECCPTCHMLTCHYYRCVATVDYSELATIQVQILKAQFNHQCSDSSCYYCQYTGNCIIASSLQSTVHEYYQNCHTSTCKHTHHIARYESLSRLKLNVVYWVQEEQKSLEIISQARSPDITPSCLKAV